MAFLPDKPMHSRFVLRTLNATQYKGYAKQYSNAKAGGIRCVCAWASGAGVIGIAIDLGKGIVIDYGKRKLAAICINACAYILTPAVVVVTNASRVVSVSKKVHSISAFIFECIEDSTNLGFLPLDLALFGQPIPIGSSNRFNLLTNHTDFLDL